MKRDKKRLNDGYAGIYIEKERQTDFNAKVSSKNMDDLDYVMDMAFEEKYRRERDYEFAEASRHTLSLKVKMFLVEDITNDFKVIINGTLYNIFKIDYSKEERAMYLFLEEERKIV